MAKKSTTATPQRTRRDTTATKASATKKPVAMATRVKPVRVVPTSPVVRSKTLANGQPRPKTRRGK